MSAASDQYNAESIQIAMLALQSDLSGVTIVHYDHAGQVSATALDRIVVQAMPRETWDEGKDPHNAFIYACDVKISIMLATNDPALLDKYLAAVIAANTGTAVSSIITLATNLFGARGFDWLNTNEAERNDSPNIRTADLTYKAIFGT